MAHLLRIEREQSFSELRGKRIYRINGEEITMTQKEYDALSLSDKIQLTKAFRVFPPIEIAYFHILCFHSNGSLRIAFNDPKVLSTLFCEYTPQDQGSKAEYRYLTHKCKHLYFLKGSYANFWKANEGKMELIHKQTVIADNEVPFPYTSYFFRVFIDE